MRVPRNPVLKLDEAAATRRRHGRVHCQETRCTLGEVLDMSASGMRILFSGRPGLKIGSVLPVEIDTEEGLLSLTARVVWVTKSGWWKRTAGIEFVDLTHEQLACLARLAAIAANNEYIREGIDPQARSA